MISRVVSLFIAIVTPFAIVCAQNPSGTELIRSEFTLINHYNQTVTEKDYYGKYLLVFFGFSYCAKICPAGLTKLVNVVNQVDSTGTNLLPIFISVDSERDTPQRLAEYVKLYDPKLIGLSGDEAAIAQATSSFRAYYGRVSGKSAQDYSYDHTDLIYLIGRNGEYLAHFGAADDQSAIVKRIKTVIDIDK